MKKSLYILMLLTLVSCSNKLNYQIELNGRDIDDYLQEELCLTELFPGNPICEFDDDNDDKIYYIFKYKDSNCIYNKDSDEFVFYKNNKSYHKADDLMPLKNDLYDVVRYLGLPDYVSGGNFFLYRYERNDLKYDFYFVKDIHNDCLIDYICVSDDETFRWIY